jgi:hypothetical protein
LFALVLPALLFFFQPLLPLNTLPPLLLYPRRYCVSRSFDRFPRWCEATLGEVVVESISRVGDVAVTVPVLAANGGISCPSLRWCKTALGEEVLVVVESVGGYWRSFLLNWPCRRSLLTCPHCSSALALAALAPLALVLAGPSPPALGLAVLPHSHPSSRIPARSYSSSPLRTCLRLSVPPRARPLVCVHWHSMPVGVMVSI